MTEEQGPGHTADETGVCASWCLACERERAERAASADVTEDEPLLAIAVVAEKREPGAVELLREIMRNEALRPSFLSLTRRIRKCLAAADSKPSSVLPCECTSEQGDSDCPRHPTCHSCGEHLTDEDGTPRIAGLAAEDRADEAAHEAVEAADAMHRESLAIMRADWQSEKATREAAEEREATVTGAAERLGSELALEIGKSKQLRLILDRVPNQVREMLDEWDWELVMTEPGMGADAIEALGAMGHDIRERIQGALPVCCCDCHKDCNPGYEVVCKCSCPVDEENAEEPTDDALLAAAMSVEERFGFDTVDGCGPEDDADVAVLQTRLAEAEKRAANWAASAMRQSEENGGLRGILAKVPQRVREIQISSTPATSRGRFHLRIAEFIEKELALVTPIVGPCTLSDGCRPDCSVKGHMMACIDVGEVPCPNGCGVRCDCGGSCCLDRDHDGDHLCAGDMDGPGSCPA